MSFYSSLLMLNCCGHSLLRNAISTNVIVKRFDHRFRASLNSKQVRFLDRLDREVEETMNKIKTRQKVRVKRKKAPIMETTQLLLNQQAHQTRPDLLPPETFSAGSPEQLSVRRDGFNHSFLTTKMKIFNTNLMRAITEIVLTDQEFSQLFEEYKIRITQVRVSANCRNLHVYWVVENNEIETQVVAHMLNEQKGKLHELLSLTNLVNVTPWISFVYDLQASYEEEIQTRLDKCKADLVPDATKVNTTTATTSEQVLQKLNPKLEKLINFDAPVEEIGLDEMTKRKFAEFKVEETYKYTKLRMPEDMTLNVFNLDYQFLMDKVLEHVHRHRSKHRRALYDLNTVGEQLPPFDPNSPSPDYSKAQTIDYNTEERIKSMKKFVVLNRKRKDKLGLKLKRIILEQEMNRFDNYQDLKEVMEKRYEEVFRDVVPENEYENESTDSVSSDQS